jgi:hypothetical protein
MTLARRVEKINAARLSDVGLTLTSATMKLVPHFAKLADDSDEELFLAAFPSQNGRNFWQPLNDCLKPMVGT